MPPDKNLIARIQTGAPNKIIFLDLAIDQHESLIKRLCSFAELLIIDHHPPTRNLTGSRVLHVNPRFVKPQIYQSVSYLLYKILSKLVDMSDSLWIAATGIIGDYDISDSQDLLQAAAKRWDLKLFHKLAGMIESGRVVRELSAEQLVWLVAGLKGPEQGIEEGELVRSAALIDEEIDRLLAGVHEAEKTGNLILYKISSRFNLRSPVATRLSEKWPNKFIVVYEKIGKRVNIAARCQSRKWNVDKVLRQAIRGLRGSAGGHEAAGGALLDANDWEQFRSALISLLAK
jgi:nanoRNase/pAp phosphatase (c-di-AMP/oligoRNAs hydrolase)